MMEVIESQSLTDTMSETNNCTINSNNQDQDMDDAEEGEILEDGEIAEDDEPTPVPAPAAEPSSEKSKKDHKSDRDKSEKDKDKDRDRDRESTAKDRDKDKERDTKRETSSRKSSSDDTKSKTSSERDKDKERRRSGDRDKDREKERERDRRSTERDRKTSSAADDDRERRRRERKRMRKHSSDEEERDDFRTKMRRQRAKEWEYEQNSFIGGGDSYDIRRGISPNSEDSEDNDYEEMLRKMASKLKSDEMVNTIDGRMRPSEKKDLLKNMMMLVLKHDSMDPDVSRWRDRKDQRSREKRTRTRDHTPGPTGTRTVRHLEPRSREQSFKQTCKFFLDGKCHKGSDCSFPHDGSPTKRKEICKFYLQGFCGKGEGCLFMHSDFPCKFYHTGVECYSGDNCRFSHAPLTPDTREILRNYLDSGELPDDPKPEPLRNESDMRTDNSNTNNSNTFVESTIVNQQSSAMNTSTTPTTTMTAPMSTYVPVKPVSKRHAVLGEATKDIKTSYHTWQWQQEMKELELAYVGNKRNLFCIDKQFVITEKPSTPRMEDDEEEIERQIRYYMESGTLDNDNKPIKTEEEQMIQASAHDEDLRSFTMPQRISNDQSKNNNNNGVVNNELNDTIASQQSSVPSSDVPSHVPKSVRDLYMKIQNRQTKTADDINDGESSDSDEDSDDHVIKAAMKKAHDQMISSPEKKKGNNTQMDISKMLSAIRQTTNTSSSSNQSDFWQNIFSNTNLPSSSPSSGQSGSSPHQRMGRDPRLKRSGKEIESPSPSIDSIIKICDASVHIDYKLLPIDVQDIDYSCYVSIYRIDSRLKNDPRLQKFFSKLPTSVIDHLSRVVPPPLKTAPVTPLSILKSKKKEEKERKEKHSHAHHTLSKSSHSPPLPPLPPLTVSPSKTVLSQGIIPPPPPPIMSPLELISSKPSFTVTDSKVLNDEITIKKSDDDFGENLVIKSDILSPEAKSEEKNPLSLSLKIVKRERIESESDSDTNTNTNPVIVKKMKVSSDSSPIRKHSIDSIKSESSLSSPPIDTKPLSVSTLLLSPSMDQSLNIKFDLQRSDSSVTDHDEDIYSNLDDDDIEDGGGDRKTENYEDNAHNKIINNNPLTFEPKSDDEFEMIRNELQAQAPIQTDSEPEMEIDMGHDTNVIRKHSDSFTNVDIDSCDEPSDIEHELAIASETEDNNSNAEDDANEKHDSDIKTSIGGDKIMDNESEITNNLKDNDKDNYNYNDDDNEPINLITKTEAHDNDANDDPSLKSVFSTIDPTASPFC